MKKYLLLQESRGSIINDLDKAIDNGYKVKLSYYNEGSGQVITRSLYIFSRGITSTGKMCYRAFQYSPNSGEMGYRSKKNHGWRLFDVENIVNYFILNKQSKLWIKGEIPEWLSKLNVENDKMFPKGTQKYMNINLFTDKHRGNASVKNRQAKYDLENPVSIDNDKETDNNPNPQTSLFDEPVNNVPQKRKYTKRRPKEDHANQEKIDFDSVEDINKEAPQNIEPEKEINNPEDETDVENREKDVDQIKETIKKRDLLKWREKEI